MKVCEVCNKEIPDDFQNLLCLSCYEKQAQIPKEEPKAPPEANLSEREGIIDPNYQENPEKDDKEQWATNIRQFEKTGVLLWHPTRNIYEFIKTWCLDKVTAHVQYPKYIWKPKIVDVGCGIGVGTNILSEEADFVWGIDKNLNSIKFATQAFSRIKNGIYYSSQVTFEQMDIMEDSREFLKFDVVVVVEVIEHIKEAKRFIETLIRKFDKRKPEDPTTYFFSTPNRNNDKIQKDRPKNSYHVREYTSEEVMNLLRGFFSNVELFNDKGERVEGDTKHTPILAKCHGAK